MKVYGIKNCDTVKKALTWLDKNNIKYEFHDFKKLGIDERKLQDWSAKVGWENIINKKGTTWKKLSPEEQQSATEAAAAFKLMQEKTSVIKRPVVESDNLLIQGFNEKEYEEQLLK